jgi:hypothetical protein
MSATVLYMSISLDGFIAGPNERLDNGLGDGGDACTSGCRTPAKSAVRRASTVR